MPWEDGTLTPDDVAERLGVPVDDRVTDATDVARAWAQRRRGSTDPLALWSDALAWDGGVRYAVLLVQSATQPAGFPSWEPDTGQEYTAFIRAADHVGADPMIA